MLIETLGIGVVVIGGHVVWNVGFSKLRQPSHFLPSKKFKGSIEDIDPQDVAFHLVLTRMLQKPENISLTGDSLRFTDTNILFTLVTSSYFYDSGWVTSSDNSCTIKVGKDELKFRLSPLQAEKINKLLRVQEEHSKQAAKRAANETALSVIEALTVGNKKEEVEASNTLSSIAGVAER